MAAHSPLYQPLNNREIRLLRLLPASNLEDVAEDIHGILETV